MKKNLKKIASFLAIVMTLMSFGLVSVMAAGDRISELGNTAAMSGLAYSTGISYEGDRALHFTSAGEMTTPAKLGLIKGETYDISFYIKGLLTSGNGMYLRAGWSYTANAAKIKSDANGVFTVPVGTGEGILSITPASDGWYKVESTTPWTVAEMNIGFFNVQGGGTIDFYIDNFSIIDENGNEMVENGGFEENTDIISEFGNTTVIDGLSYSEIKGYGDKSSIHVNVNHTTETQVNIAKAKTLGVLAGKEYNFSFYIKGLLTTSKGMYIRLGWTNNANAAQIKSNANGVITASIGADVLNVEDAGDGWYKVSTATPWECTDGGIDFFKVMSGSEKTDFYIDNFSIEEYVEPNTDIITEFGNTTVIEGLSYSDEVGYDDSSSIHVKVNHANETEVNIAKAKNLGVVAGKEYNFSFYIKGLLTTSKGMYIRLGWANNVNAAQIKSNANGVITASIGADVLNVEDAGDGWYKVSTATPWKCTESGIDFFKVISGTEKTDFYIDNFSIEEVEVLDIPRGTIITELKNTEENSFLSYSNEEAYDGVSSLLVKGDAGEKIIAPLNSEFGIKAGEEYKVSFYFKGTITTMYFRLGWSYTGGSVVINNNAVADGGGGEYTTITELDDGWYKFESNMTANADTEMIRLKGNNNFYMDQLSIIDSNGNELVTNGSFEAPAHQTTDFEIVDNGSGNYTVNVLVKNNSAGDDFTAHLILATHKDKTMQNLAMGNTAIEVAPGNTVRVSQNITVAEGETLTAFLWDSVLGMTPLANSDVLITAE